MITPADPHLTDHTTRPEAAATVWDWLPVRMRNREGLVYEAFTVAVKGAMITVSAPFRTDFASIPRIMTWLFPRTGWWLAAAIMHDQLYAIKAVSRTVADRRFLEALCILRDQSGGRVGWFDLPEGRPAHIRRWINRQLNRPVPWIFYWGVRIGGGSHY